MFFIRILFVILFTVSIAVAAGGSGGSSGGSGGDGVNYGKYSAELKPIFVMINNEMYEEA